MNKLIALFLIFATLYNPTVWAGLPPTTTKGNGDSSPVTTFEIDLPWTLTHTGVKANSTVANINTSLGDILSNGTVAFSANQSMGSNKITSVTDPTSAQDAATKNYVDTQLSYLNPADSVFAASTADITGTYTNAVSGVCIGDTFTVTATGALSLDGTSPTLGVRVLLKNQASSFQDGVWTVTVVGSIGVSPVLTRALDFDSSADINSGQIIPIINGTANAGSSYFQTATNTTCNSSSQTWTQFQRAASAYLQVASNLTDVGSATASFNNISPLTTLGDTLYASGANTSSRLAGNTTSTKKFLSQTGNGSVSAAPAWGQPAFTDITGTLAIGSGGTGQTTANTAANALLPSQTSNSGKFLKTDGTNTSWSTTSALGTVTWVTKTANYTVTSSDIGVICGTATSAAFTLTLPAASSVSGLQYFISNNSSYIVTLAPNGTDSIFNGGASTNQTLSPGASVILISDGSSNYNVF